MLYLIYEISILRYLNAPIKILYIYLALKLHTIAKKCSPRRRILPEIITQVRYLDLT